MNYPILPVPLPARLGFLHVHAFYQLRRHFVQEARWPREDHRARWVDDQWVRKREVRLGTRHGDVEEAPLFFYAVRFVNGTGVREATFEQSRHEHRFPLQAFGLVDGGEDNGIGIFTVRRRADTKGFLQTHVRQERVERRVLSGEERQLLQVLQALVRVLVLRAEVVHVIARGNNADEILRVKSFSDFFGSATAAASNVCSNF